MTEVDVVIVGSGPYALSLAAHLRARRVDFRAFGPPMSFWRGMPPGLNLKSYAFATNIHVPERGHTFPEWCRARRLEDHEPCTMESYAAYGMWMKERFAPQLEPVEVANVVAAPRGYDVTLATGERLLARNVVSATGLSGLAYTPDVLRPLPPELASHTFSLDSFTPFAGKEVAVIGAGASAIEAAALVHEAGGSAVLLVRDTEARYNTRAPRERSLLERVRAPETVLGAGRKNWLLQHLPYAVHFLPEKRRIRLTNGYLPPVAPWWIRDRVEGRVDVRVRTSVIDARPAGTRVRLRLRSVHEGEHDLEVDHVIAGTGYRLDVDRLGYLDESLRRRLRRTSKAPALSLSFESTSPGLYFMGPLSALSFGPVFRFVAGARVAAPAVARRIAATAHRRAHAAR